MAQFAGYVSCCLTGIAADGEAMVRAQAFACAYVQRARFYMVCRS
jgi:hypothetical protein